MDFASAVSTETFRRVVVTVGAAVVLTPASSLRAQQADKPFAAFSASVESLRDSIVAMARAQIGKRYRRGGESPERGFDCSGFVHYILGQLQFTTPRTARLQATIGEPLVRDTSQLLPGDLLTFGRGAKGAVSHVGIYVGNGRYVHASSVAGRVIESSIDRPPSPLIKVWRGARRLLTFGDSLVAFADSARHRG